MHIQQMHILIREEVAKAMRGIADRLSAGRAADFAEYKQQVGRIQGCGDALDAVDRVFDKLYNDDQGE